MSDKHRQANQVGTIHAPRTSLSVSDLDREELLFLVDRLAFRPSERDLWRARWEVLTERETAARAISNAADRAWSDAIDEFARTPYRPRAAWEAVDAKVRACDLAMRRAQAATRRARDKAEAAYAALDAGDR